MKRIIFILLFGVVFLGCSEKDDNKTVYPEMNIVKILPTHYEMGDVFKIGDVKLFNSEEELQDVLGSRYWDKDLVNLDYQKYTVLLGRMGSKVVVKSLEHSLKKLGDKKYEYSLNMYYYKDAPNQTAFFMSVVEKLPTNSRVLLKVKETILKRQPKSCNCNNKEEEKNLNNEPATIIYNRKYNDYMIFLLNNQTYYYSCNESLPKEYIQDELPVVVSGVLKKCADSGDFRLNIISISKEECFKSYNEKLEKKQFALKGVVKYSDFYKEYILVSEEKKEGGKYYYEGMENLFCPNLDSKFCKEGLKISVEGEYYIGEEYDYKGSKPKGGALISVFRFRNYKAIKIE